MSNIFSITNQRQIRLLCKLLRMGLMLFLVIQIVFFLISWILLKPSLVGPWTMQILPDGITPEEALAMTGWQNLMGVVIGLPSLALLVRGVLSLLQTLRQFEQGAIFSALAIGHLRLFAGAIFLSIVLTNFEKPMRALVFAWSNGIRIRDQLFTFDITSNEILLFIICGLFYLITWIMDEGRRLAEENEGFV